MQCMTTRLAVPSTAYRNIQHGLPNLCAFVFGSILVLVTGMYYMLNLWLQVLGVGRAHRDSGGWPQVVPHRGSGGWPQVAPHPRDITAHHSRWACPRVGMTLGFGKLAMPGGGVILDLVTPG